MCSLSSPLCALFCCAVLMRLGFAVRVVCAVSSAWCCGALLFVVLFCVVFCVALQGLVAPSCPLVACLGVVSLPGRVACFSMLGVERYSPVLCSVVLCCGVVLCCRSLLSFCVAICAGSFFCPVPWCCAALWCCAAGLCRVLSFAVCRCCSFFHLKHTAVSIHL